MSSGLEQAKKSEEYSTGNVDEALARAFERRARHRERSLFVRAGVVAAGGVVSLSAVLLSVVTPEFGLPLLLFGLRLLALEFDWAARLYAKVAKLAKRAAGGLRRLLPKSRLGFAVTVVGLAGALGLVFALLW